MYLKRKRGRTSSKGKTCKALRAVRSSCRSPRLAEWTIVRLAPLSNNGPSRPFPSFLKGGAPQRRPLQPVVTRAVLAAHLLGSLPSVLHDEDEGIAEALRRDAEFEANPPLA
jgi:hypothetical protein